MSRRAVDDLVSDAVWLVVHTVGSLRARRRCWPIARLRAPRPTRQSAAIQAMGSSISSHAFIIGYPIALQD